MCIWPTEEDSGLSLSSSAPIHYTNRKWVQATACQDRQRRASAYVIMFRPQTVSLVQINRLAQCKTATAYTLDGVACTCALCKIAR